MSGRHFGLGYYFFEEVKTIICQDRLNSLIKGKQVTFPVLIQKIEGHSLRKGNFTKHYFFMLSEFIDKQANTSIKRKNL